MDEVAACELELGLVHFNKLVHTIEEKYEEWRIVLAIIHVLPRFHLQLGSLDLRRYHLPVDFFAVAALDDEGQFLHEVVLGVYPFFVDQGAESRERSIIRI